MQTRVPTHCSSQRVSCHRCLITQSLMTSDGTYVDVGDESSEGGTVESWGRHVR